MKQLANGHKFAPQYIEGSLKFSPYVRDAIVLGDETVDYVSAIINIDFDSVSKWAEDHHIAFTTFADLSQKPQVYKLLQKDIERVNRNLSEPSMIKRFALLHKEFDPDEAELTRTRKLRRSFVEERYGDLINAIYSGQQEVMAEAEVKYRDGRKGKITTAIRIVTVD